MCLQRSGGVWAQQAYVKASNAAVNDAAARACRCLGTATRWPSGPLGSQQRHGNRGNQADNSAGLSGAVYMFVRSGTV